MLAVITGTSGDIGRAIVEKFLQEGLTVYGVDVKEAAVTHPAYVHVQGDICTGDFTALPAPDILISAAGTLEEADALAVNLQGTIRFTELLKDSPKLKSVLFIASASARNGAEFPMYVASKAGLVGYMKNLALALAKRGITVNSISPGGVRTASNGHILQDEKQQVFHEQLI